MSTLTSKLATYFEKQASGLRLAHRLLSRGMNQANRAGEVAVSTRGANVRSGGIPIKDKYDSVAQANKFIDANAGGIQQAKMQSKAHLLRDGIVQGTAGPQATSVARGAQDIGRPTGIYWGSGLTGAPDSVIRTRLHPTYPNSASYAHELTHGAIVNQMRRGLPTDSITDSVARYAQSNPKGFRAARQYQQMQNARSGNQQHPLEEIAADAAGNSTVNWMQQHSPDKLALAERLLRQSSARNAALGADKVREFALQSGFKRLSRPELQQRLISEGVPASERAFRYSRGY